MPLIERAQLDQIYKYAPIELLPSGFNELAASALEHPNDCGEFVTECYRLFDGYVDAISLNGKSTDADYYWKMLGDEMKAEIINLVLCDFHQQFINKTKLLLGVPEIKLLRVVSLRVNNGVCVDLKLPPLTNDLE